MKFQEKGEIEVKDDNILAEVRKRAEAERLLLDEIEELAAGNVVTSELIRKCLLLNERGDGILYAMANRGKLIYNINAGEMYRWAGHYWEIDKSHAHINAVELVAELYSGEACRVYNEMKGVDHGTTEWKKLFDLHKALNRRAFKLRSIRGLRVV
jgi:hypothetical protein